MATVELHQIKKSFGDVAVIHGVDLTINEGEFVVFVGPSGSGKSTLLRMIAGLETVTEGDVLIDGEDVTFAEPSERGIAMVFQSYALYPHMNVFNNMAFNLRLSKLSKSEVHDRVHEAARILRLEDLLDRSPAQLSGGQRQRVAIGRAIVRKPKVFLFDEPLSNLDASLRVQMRLEIERLHRELDATMIYVTHDQVEAMTLADRIVVLDNGKLQQVGDPLELYKQPNNEFVGGFIGSPKMNFLDGVVISSKGKTSEIKLDVDENSKLKPAIDGLNENETIRVGVRPEVVKVYNAKSKVSKGHITLAATVETVERLGNISYGYFNVGTDEPFVVQIIGETDLKAEQSCFLALPLEKLHIFNASGLSVTGSPKS